MRTARWFEVWGRARAGYLEEQLNEVQDAPENLGEYGDPVMNQRAAWTEKERGCQSCPRAEDPIRAT